MGRKPAAVALCTLLLLAVGAGLYAVTDERGPREDGASDAFGARPDAMRREPYASATMGPGSRRRERHRAELEDEEQKGTRSGEVVDAKDGEQVWLEEIKPEPVKEAVQVAQLAQEF